MTVRAREGKKKKRQKLRLQTLGIFQTKKEKGGVGSVPCGLVCYRVNEHE